MKYLSVVVSGPFNTAFTYSVKDEDERETFFGKRVIVPFGKGEKTGFVIKEEISEEKKDENFEIKNIKRVVDKEAVFNKDLLQIAEWMEKMYLSPLGTNLSIMIPSGRRESEASPFSSVSSFAPIKELSKEQEKALSTLRNNDKNTYYLFGVTGSGKSEVYLRRAEDVIKEGGQVLYMVPEITLTHQLTNEVYSRFSERVAIIHSKLSPSQRLKMWNQIQRGDVDIVIGARSSVFAPFKNLKLIIIDEEHESSYKSGSTPRYHARQIAQFRAQLSSCQLIMGSATPSLEAWRLIREQRMASITMNNRIGEGRYPKISIVNMAGENRNISQRLEDEIRETLNEKRGVILFLNRRGFSYGYVCSSCSHIIECPNCSISLTYHKKDKRLVCHTCGYSTPLIKSCPICNSRDLIPSGFGTELAEEEVRSLFPTARIERLDTDRVSGDKEKVGEIIERFKNGEIDILLGTQMIAKGLNFPLLKLVGVLNADSSLSLPDFRAGEHTFSLLHQVAGRAGRYSDDGKVIVQTTQPLARAITALSTNNVEYFYDRELSERREIIFPPYSRLVNLTIRGKNEERVKEASLLLERKADEINDSEDVEVFASSPCLVEKMAGQFRYHVLLRSTRIGELLSFTSYLLQLYKLPYGLHIEVDVDPLSIL